YVKGTVYDAITKVKLSAGFELIDLVTAEIIMKSTSYATGEFILCLPSDKDYALNVSKEGYLFYSGNFSLEGVRKYIDPFEIDIPLYPIMVGKKIILRNIFFETDSYELLDESKVELNKLVDFMKKNPSVIAEISGHTDNIGTNEDNQILSENRAEAVANYLAKHNIDPKRLSTKGYGESRPVDTNENEEGRAQNRRTEFTIIGN
ncbi:MAG: OmpA family protein, partial [Bacteroidales bacterium]|nr:OmpA family protein [Bacteroidales bacterium]